MPCDTYDIFYTSDSLALYGFLKIVLTILSRIILTFLDIVTSRFGSSEVKNAACSGRRCLIHTPVRLMNTKSTKDLISSTKTDNIFRS